MIAGRLPLVPLPQPLLEIVLRNLVSNALEAGAGAIEVFAPGDDAICVRDDGCGVAPEEADRIFGAYSGKHATRWCSKCVRGRLPLAEALRDELGPLFLAPAVQHLEVGGVGSKVDARGSGISARGRGPTVSSRTQRRGRRSRP